MRRARPASGPVTSRPGFKDRRGATFVTPRRLREERVLHSPARYEAGEPIPPAALSARRAGGSLVVRLVQKPLGVRHQFLYPLAHDRRLFFKIFTYLTNLALKAAAVLLDGLLYDAPTLAQLTLELRPSPANLTLEAVAGRGAATLVALELTLEAGAGAVLGT
jgi:hypothetical protein